MKKVLFLAILASFLLSSCSTTRSIYAHKRHEVEAIVGYLTLHPAKVMFKGLDKKEYYFFIDVENSCLWFTSDADIYKKIGDALPELIESSGKAVKISGTTINPFARFSKRQILQGMRSMGYELNQFKVAMIFGYGFDPNGQPGGVKYTPPKTNPWGN